MGKIPCPVCGKNNSNKSELLGTFYYVWIECSQCGRYVFYEYDNKDPFKQAYDVKKLASFLASNKRPEIVYILTYGEEGDRNLYNNLLKEYKKNPKLVLKPCLLYPTEVDAW